MTAQIDDIFRYHGDDYSLAGISESELFDPLSLGMQPVGVCSACWRGFYVVYAVVDGHLVVAELHVCLLGESGDSSDRLAGPVINGVTPSPDQDEDDWFNNHYTGLNERLNYTGGVLIARGFIEDLYVHMGFQAPWKYQNVVELIFDSGAMTQQFDRSEQMAAIRTKAVASLKGTDEDRLHTPEDIHTFVERAFDRTYRI